MNLSVQNMTAKQRDITFDIMKGIGILLVIVCHLIGWNHPMLAQIILSFHMPLFFIVAGIFSKPYVDAPSAKANVKRYFARLYPPFAITQLLIVAWAVLMAVAKHEGWDPPIRESLSLVWADVFGPSTPWGRLSLGVIWFLMALFVAKSLLIPLSRLKQWAIPVSLAVAFATLLLHKVFPYSIWCLSLGLMALPFVTIGWWVKNHPVPLWLKIVVVVCWIAAICFSRMEMYAFTWKCYPLDVLGACGGTYCVYLLSLVIKKYLSITSKALSALGVWSLAIMCVHCFEMYAHLGNHIRAAVGIELGMWLMFAWRVVLTLGLAIVLVHIPKVKNLFL